METIYSGYDTIQFAVKGAMNPTILRSLRHAKERAIEKDTDQPIKLNDYEKEFYIKPIGQKGGFAFVLDFGFDAYIISIKDNNKLEHWNGFVKLRALGLALNGHDAAIQAALATMKSIGFDVREVSLNRVDYAIDILTDAPIELDPDLFVTHCHRKIDCYYPLLATTSQSRQIQTIRIGRMPNSQITIYDKRQEAITKRNYEWFRLWNIDKNDPDKFIRRVEIRLGKAALRAAKVTRISTLESRVPAALTRVVADTRYILKSKSDTNRSRRALHPLWSHVTSHLSKRLEPSFIDIEPSKFYMDRKEAKAEEYRTNVLGNLIGRAVTTDVPFMSITDVIEPILNDLRLMQKPGNDLHSLYAEKYNRTKDRLHL